MESPSEGLPPPASSRGGKVGARVLFEPEPEPQPELLPQPQPRPEPEPEPEMRSRPNSKATGGQAAHVPGGGGGAAEPAPEPETNIDAGIHILSRMHRWATRESDGTPRRGRPPLPLPPVGEAAAMRVRAVLDEMIPVLHPGRAMLYVVDKHTDEMLPLCTIGLGAVECVPYTLGIGIAGEAALSGLASIVPAADHDHRYDAQSDLAAAAAAADKTAADSYDDDDDEAEEGVSVLCLPLFSSHPVDVTDPSDSEQARAVLQLANSNAHPFQSSDLQLAGHLCANVGDLLVAEWADVLSFARAIPPTMYLSSDAYDKKDRTVLTIAPQPRATNSSHGGPLDFKAVAAQVMKGEMVASLLSPSREKKSATEEAEPTVEPNAVESARQIIANVLRVASDMALADHARFHVVSQSTSQIWPAYFHNKKSPDGVDFIGELAVSDITPRSLSCGTVAANCAVTGKPIMTWGDPKAVEAAAASDEVSARSRATTFAARPASPDGSDGHASPHAQTTSGGDQSPSKGRTEDEETTSDEPGGILLCAPLFCRGQIIGVVQLQHDLELKSHAKIFDKDDIEMVSGLCSDVGEALVEGTSTQTLTAAMLTLAKQHMLEATHMRLILGAASVSRAGHEKRRRSPRPNAPSPRVESARARSMSGLRRSRSATAGHSGLWGLGSKETERQDDLTALRHRQYSEGMLWRRIVVASRALIGTPASRSDAAFAFAIAWYCIGLPLHLAFADGMLAVQRDDVLISPLVPPTSASSDQPWGVKSVVKRGLTSFRAGGADPTDEDFGVTSDSSWLVLIVLWADYLADLAVVVALFQWPRVSRFFDAVSPRASKTTPLTAGFAKQHDLGCQLHVRGIGDLFESEEALIEMFSYFGEVKLAVVRHRTTEEGENTSWAIVTMGHPAGVDEALADQASLPEPVTVTRFNKKQAAASKGAMAHAWGADVSERDSQLMRLKHKGSKLLSGLAQIVQTCVAPDRYAKHGNSGQELSQRLKCLCALPLYWLLPAGWVNIVGLIRLVQVPRGVQIMKKWAQQAALHYAVVNIVKAIILLVLLSHWLGCTFLALLKSDAQASAWMPQVSTQATWLPGCL